MNPLFERAVARQERALGVPLAYLRTIGDASMAAFLKFGLFAPLAAHRRVVPPAPWHLARLAATRVQDCGACVQIVVNAARADGVPAATLRAALADALDQLPELEALAHRFGHAVAAREANVDALRGDVAQFFGEEGVVELALAIATAQLFPIVKRGLGQAQACSLVQVDV